MDEQLQLTLDDYQVAANGTAIYPRLFTEIQVQLIAGYMSVALEELHKVEAWRVLDAVREAMDTVETPFNRLVYPALGLAGESGELANKIKKFARDTNGEVMPEDLVSLADELGDTLWYDAAFATGLGVSLGEVAEVNIKKLADRADRGVIKGSGDTR